MNHRILKCKTSWVYAIGEEGSLADKKEKSGHCLMCNAERCEYRQGYIDDYENHIKK